MPYFSNENAYIAVPEDFIKNLLPGANPTFIKVYLYLLMIASHGGVAEYADVADTLGILESDLVASVRYWEKCGVLTSSGDSVVFHVPPQAGVPVMKNHEKEESAPKHTHPENIAKIVAENKELSDMFMLAQEIMGKTITEHDMETIYWFNSELKMTPEVILLLLEYCVSKGKNRISYIEKVAVSWKEMGLNSTERVAEYLKDEEQKTGFLYSIRKIMGISDRSLSQIEEKYLTKWHEEFLMSEEMIALAYEYCIIQTAKLSFPYMDKILTRWHDEGITTVPAAEEDNKRFKNRTRRSDTEFDDVQYEQEDIESLTRNY